MKKHYFPLLLIVSIAIISLSSCSERVYSSKLKADVIGFNDDVDLSYGQHAEPFNLANQEQYKMMRSKVLTLKSGSQTSALYAMDLGLKRVKEVKKKFMEKDPKSKYYVVCLTDGLDNNSMKLAENKGRGHYSSPEKYGDVLQKRMTTLMNSGLKKNYTNQFQSYVLLYKGDDLDGYDENELNQKLSPFTGSQNAKRPNVLQATDLNELLRKFQDEFVIASFDFEIPKDYAGKRIRMQLNNATDESEKVYIEFDLSRSGSRYSLRNIRTSAGLSCEIPRGGEIKMEKTTSKKSSKALFSINDLKENGVAFKIQKQQVTQWFYEMNKFRKNSEYTADASDKKNAYILVILDTSISFKSEITRAKNTILEIVKVISEEL